MVNNREDIVIIGFGGHAKSVADSIMRTKLYNIVGYTDVHECRCDFRYLGMDEVLSDVYETGVRNAAIGIGFMGDSDIRDSVVEYAKKIGFNFPQIIDPSAAIASDAIIGEGAYVGKNTVINADSKVGRFCIINTGAIVEHECIVGDFTHIAVGAVMCGNVWVGQHTLVGAGANIIQGVKIGDDCIVGLGSTVLSDVDNNMKVYGIVKNSGGGSLPVI